MFSNVITNTVIFKFPLAIALMGFGPLSQDFRTPAAGATFKGPFSVKTVKKGKKNPIVEIGSLIENAQGLVELDINACGTELVFASPPAELKTDAFLKFVEENVKKVCD